MDFHIYIHTDSATEIKARLDHMAALLTGLNDKGTNMSAQLDALKAAVARNTEVEESAVTLISGLADQIRALKDDPVALQQLADDVSAEAEKLAAAVATNTPAAPAP